MDYRLTELDPVVKISLRLVMPAEELKERLEITKCIIMIHIVV